MKSHICGHGANENPTLIVQLVLFPFVHALTLSKIHHVGELNRHNKLFIRMTSPAS